MAIVVYESQKNGLSVHYYTGSGDPCHSAVIQGSLTVDDGNPVSTDLIQLDAVSLGVIVPVMRNDIAYSEAHTSSPSFHFATGCDRT